MRWLIVQVDFKFGLGPQIRVVSFCSVSFHFVSSRLVWLPLLARPQSQLGGRWRAAARGGSRCCPSGSIGGKAGKEADLWLARSPLADSRRASAWLRRLRQRQLPPVRRVELITCQPVASLIGGAKLEQRRDSVNEPATFPVSGLAGWSALEPEQPRQMAGSLAAEI